MGYSLNPYPNLDEEGIAIPLEWDALAKLIVAQNYGFLRMCAAMTREIRKRQIEGIARFAARGDHDIKYNTPIADAIEREMAAGAFE